MVERHLDIEIDNRLLAGRQWGSARGTDLVLLHGYSGSMHDFEPHVAPLSATRRVLAIDHRGHGQSGRCDNPGDYRVAHIAADTIQWLKRQAQGPVDLLGHSMGGRVALEVALAQPELVRSLILMSTTAWSFAIEPEEARTLFLDFLTSLGPDTDLAIPYQGPEGDMIVQETSEAYRSRRNELVASLDLVAMRELGHELFDDRLAHLGERLSEISIPTTVIVGSEDGVFRTHAPALADGVLHGALVVIPGAYHSPQLTHPVLWRDAVELHLAALPK